jgi:hypothetical protein
MNSVLEGRATKKQVRLGPAQSTGEGALASEYYSKQDAASVLASRAGLHLIQVGNLQSDLVSNERTNLKACSSE